MVEPRRETVSNIYALYRIEKNMPVSQREGQEIIVSKTGFPPELRGLSQVGDRWDRTPGGWLGLSLCKQETSRLGCQQGNLALEDS